MNSVREFFKFLRDAWDELKLVSWLTRNQMLASTWLVILFVIVFAVYVGLLDWIIGRAFRIFI